ncbi:MAG: L,D-transpeptidase family protein [Mariprofundales bacterium]|nr:L,D-transpeptidase family protein [Mariprofundales bacterium]
MLRFIKERVGVAVGDHLAGLLIVRSAVVMLMVVLFLSITTDTALAEDQQRDWVQVANALRANDLPQIKSLSADERVVLRAAVALKMQRPADAIKLLSGNSNQQPDPLAALIEAEAHRRQALSALHEAGSYAHGVERERVQLASVQLNPWLREADVKLEELRDELNGSLLLPVDLLQLSSDVVNVFMIDKQRSRLFLFSRDADGSLRKVADEYVVTGAVPGDKKMEGDGRTPTGVYRFVQRLEGRSLEQRYGPVAFPIDYPNVLDRMHHKKGHGIWLHGYAPQVNRRPPRDTKGCFSLANDLLVQLAPQIVLGRSWVVVGNRLRFDDERARAQLRRSVAGALEEWLNDWSSLNTKRYLHHYHPSFRSGRYNLASWRAHKRYVNSHKRSISVTISAVTMIRDPNPREEGEVVIAQFKQHYRSDNYHDDTLKRLYLVRANERQSWRILSEETLSAL